MIATYNLAKRLPCFDFYYWQAVVQGNGATKIVFDISKPKTIKFPLDDVMERYRSILEPGPALAGLKSRTGTDPGLDAENGAIYDWYRSGKRFKRLQTVKPPVQCNYTVTIRENIVGKARARDSNRDAWYRFAEEIGAVLIEDYYRKPIHLHDRMALYAGAKMNFGVCNGPTALITLSEYPVTMFVNSLRARQSLEKCAVYENQKLPWMLDNQCFIWHEDSFDNLRRAFDQWATATTSSQQVSHAG